MSSVSLVAGMLAAIGLGTAPASAAPPAPGVEASPSAHYIAGEDVDIAITFTSDEAAGNQYNLSAAIVLPEGVTVVDTGALGTPLVYPSDPADRVIPGNYADVAGDCTVLGLEPASPGNSCQVPLGTQFLVFQNISDLPQGASTTHTVTLRPDADVFPVGSPELILDITAYTSSNERLIPLFPGSTGVADDNDETSAPGAIQLDVPVHALRLEKSEPSPESELLRGVHRNTTTYTLRVWHTGEGDIDDVEVVDFLPAGLEYLGQGGIENTTDANGTRGEFAEYPDADSLDLTPPPADSAWEGAVDPARNAAAGIVETVETVIPTADEVTTYGLVPGEVYTKVTWNLGTLLAAGGADDIVVPRAQDYADDAGEPGFVEIRYRAGIPLFENTLDFDGAGGQPSEPGSHAANLDNNRGASTRHGSVQTVPGLDDNGDADALRNVAGVSGSYLGDVAPEGDATSSDVAEYTVDAVDVRLLKSVDDSEFRQGELATYTLTIETSEYTSAELGAGVGSGIRPNRLVDDLSDGICPVFPNGVAVTPDASEAGAGIPRLVIGDPTPGGSVGADLTPSDWTTALGALGSDCGFPSSEGGASLTGATLSGIAFDPVSGHFFLDLAIDALTDADELEVVYTALQNSSYAQGGNVPGATSSGDSVANTAELMMTTTSIAALDDVTSAGVPEAGIPSDVADGVWRAWDDSSASLEAELSKLSKHVLHRGAGVPARDDIANPAVVPESAWVKNAEDNEPFAVGDEVWYRIKVMPPAGTDVRNPKLTDFLPEGVAFDDAPNPVTERPENIWIVPSSERGLGTCAPTDAVDWLGTFVPNDGITINGNVLTFELGADDCFNGGSTDRFLPLETELAIYIKVKVVDPAAFAAVDLPENLAKYQQNNVDGKIFFLRDAAEIEVDGGPALVKGIRANSNAESDSTAGLFGYYSYNSDVDGTPSVENVVQGDEVTFRLDVSAPRASTTDYVIWDALPAGITKADLKDITSAGTFASSAATVTKVWTPPADGFPGFWSPVESAPTGTWTATAYDPIDAGYPDDVREEIELADRTVIVWTYDGIAPGSIPEDDSVDPAIPATFQGITLAYTVVIPDGTDGGPAAELTQRYENDASIVEFAYVSNNAAAPTRVIVNGAASIADDRVADEDAGEFAFSDADGVTSDPSRVFVPDTLPTKRLVSTEVGPTTALGGDGPVGLVDLDDVNNAQDEIAQGEHATFEYAITIPANTTVRGATLSDGGAFGYGSNWGSTVDYAYVDGSAAFSRDGVALTCGTTSADFQCAETLGDEHGVLTFPEVYTNTTTVPQIFRVQLTVWVTDADASNPDTTPNLGHDALLRNTATFAYDDPNSTTGGRVSHDAHATVRYIEPGLGITKGASKTADVTLNDTITYTLTVTNDSRPTAYENTVVDVVPEGLIVNPSSFRIDGGTTAPAGVAFDTGVTTGAGGAITWAWDAAGLEALAEIPSSVTLRYTATIDPTTGGGRSYTNDASVTGHTLPSDVLGDDTTLRRGDRAAAASREITATTATITKGVRVEGAAGYAPATSAPVGETVQYRVNVTLNPSINYYDVQLTDVVPAGLDVQGTPSVHLTTGASAAVDVTDDWTRATSGQTQTWTYTRADADGDLLQDALPRMLTITYDALITTDVAASTPRVTNTASFAWAPTDGGALITPPPTATADVTILNPDMTIAKHVMRSTGDSYGSAKNGPVDQEFTYRLRANNTNLPAGARSPAYNVVVTDAVPAGIVVDTSSFTNAVGTVTFTEGVEDGTGGTLTWSIPGPVAAGSFVDLTYDATFVASESLTSGAKQNTARITSYESFPTGGRSYGPSSPSSANVLPQLPFVSLTKEAAGSSDAYVGEPFEWVLRASNAVSGGAAQTVVVTDELPENWTFTEVTSMSIGGVPITPFDPSGGPDGPLVWTFGADAVGGSPAPILLPGRVIVITYTATPTDPDAVASPGVGAGNPHVNRVSASTTDRRNATGSASGPYTGPPAEASAFLREANLHLVKDANGGVITEQTAPDNALRGVPVGSWVAGQAPVTGQYAQPQWSIAVTNQGPSASFGPFEIVDTTTLPAGVTTGSWTARYYSSAGDTVGSSLPVAGTGTSTDPLVVGGSTTSLRPDGTDRIELVANVAIAATAASGAIAENIASVTGRTYEDPDNLDDNQDDAEKPVTVVADLRIAKSISNPAPATVGEAITWNLTITNLGPSLSASTDERITVTDTVPSGVGNVTATSTTDWVASVTRDGDPIDFPARAGDIVTWTYQGDAMPVGVPSSVTLTGTVLSSHTGALTNTASVHPGDTPDPVTPNNTDDTTVTPNDETTLEITKMRVVWNADTSSWVPAAGLDPTPQIVPGEQVSYFVSVLNPGVADARDVQVVDEAPAGLSYVSHTDAVGTWTDASGGDTSIGADPNWTTFTLVGTQEAGAFAGFVVTYDTASTLDPATPLVNCVEVTADNWLASAALPYDRTCDSSASDRIVDLGVTKTHDAAPGAPDEPRFVSGSLLWYTITATNHGPSATAGPIVITDELPEGMSWGGSANVTVPGESAVPMSPTISGAGDRMLSWSVLDGDDVLDVGESIVVRVYARIDANVRDNVALVNTATVEGPETEPVPDPNPNQTTDSITTYTSTSMEITKDVEAGPWIAGTDIEYTLSITGNGPSAAPASVTETLPPGLTIRSMVGTGWNCSMVVVGSTSGTCTHANNGGLYTTGTSTITVVARIGANVPAGTELVNEAVLRWSDSTGPREDDDDAPITVSGVSDLGLTKWVRPTADSNAWIDAQDAATAGSAVAGASTGYRIAVSNAGPSDAVAPLVVTDTLPAGAGFGALVDSPGWTATADPATGVVTFTRDSALGGLAFGADPLEIEYTVDFDAELASGTLLTNTAALAAATLTANGDTTTANDSDPATVEIEREVDVALAKSHDPAAVRIGDDLPFELVVTNNGPSEASGIVVTDTVPAGLEVVSVPGDAVGTGWTLVSMTPVDLADPAGGVTVVAEYADPIGPGEHSAMLTLVTRVTVAAYDEVENVADVTVTEPDTDPANDRARDIVTVPPLVTLVIEKHTLGAFQVGKRANYAITVENVGPTDDPGPIVVEDVLPRGLSFASSPDAGVAVDGDTVTWTIAGLELGETVDLTLVVDVHEAAYPEVTNVATVSSASELLPASVTEDDATIAVAEADPIPSTGADDTLWLIALLLLCLGGVGLVAARLRRTA